MPAKDETSVGNLKREMNMSVAFRKEEDAEAVAADLPDRPISKLPNLVTANGLARLEADLAQARAARASAQTSGDVKGDRTAMARATRDLRYFTARRASAQLTERDPSRSGIQFGDTVRMQRDDGRVQVFRIVGEDEADPASGAISYASPLGRALLGRDLGDAVRVAGREVEVTGFDPS